MEGTDITNLMVLNAFRKCAHIQYFTGKYQGHGPYINLTPAQRNDDSA